MIEILVVDHNRADVLLFKQCLNSRYQVVVTVVEDGDQALGLFANECYRPNLVVIELNIPKLQGHELLRRIRRKNPTIPIVVLSSSRDQEDIRSAYAGGANMYAEKPSDLDRFRTTIQAIVRLWLAPPAGARAAAVG